MGRKNTRAPGSGTGATPAGVGGGSAGVAPAGVGLEVRRTRTSAMWVGVAAVLVLLILVIDFIVQNLHEDTLHFLTVNFRLPLGILVLIAVVAGGVMVLLVGAARMAQLRLMARRHRKTH